MGITRDFANIIRSNGDIVISGDLDVNGTQTTINTTTFVVEDKNIELGANATSNSQNDGAGISILLPDASPDEFATLTYGNTADAWSFNKKVGIGTSSPNTTLTLSDGTDEFDFGVTANQLIIKSVTSDGSDDQRIIIDAGNGGLSSTRGAYIALSGNEASIEAGKSIYQMGNVAGSSHVFRKAGGNDAVTIDSDGNVGIGTDSPTAVLHAKNTIDTNAASGTGVFRLQGGVSLYSGYIGFDASTMSIGTNNGTRGLSFAAGGSERMRIDSSGNVGINSLGNTTSTLDLTEPSDTAERAIRIENSSARLYVGVEGAAANRFVGSTADNGFIGTTTAQGLEFGTNNNVRMVIDTSGNIGIGTNSPSEKLHVVDTSNPGSDGTVIIEGRRDGGANVLALRARDASAPTVGLPIGQGPVMRFQGFNGTDFSDMAYISAESAAAFTDGDTPSNLIFGTTSDNTETLTERLRIDANGGIFTGGIGTGRGGIATSHLFHIDGTSKYYFELRQTDTNGNTDILFSDGTSGDYGVVGYEHAIDRMQFYTKSLRRMVIDQNGDVGIGETSPLAKLHVIRTTTDGAQRTIYADGNQLSEISSSGTNYLHNVWIENRNFDINSGVTDSGYRIGLNIEGYHDSNVFEGTLATQKNIWSRVGNNTNGTGTITNLYNMHLETLSGGGLTITNNWGLYQTGSGTKNYFEGNVGIGTDPGEKLVIYENDSSFANTTLLIHNDKADDAAVLNLRGERTVADADVGQVVFNNSTKVIAAIRSVTDTATDNGGLQFWTASSGSNAVSRAVIDSDGNVGIGTDPAVRLDVTANAASRIATFWDGGSNGNAMSNGAAVLGVSRISDGSTSLNGPIFEVGRDNSSSTSYNIDQTLFSVNSDKIIAGNNIQFTAGNGIDFSANANAAGMTSELLDDYEEGTWTPAVSTSAGTIGAVSGQTGTYTKIGNQVTLWWNFNITDIGTGSGTVVISNASKPFSHDTSISYYIGINRPRSGTSSICELDTGGNIYMYGSTTGVSFYTGTITYNVA